jgi:hypothetical protein
MLKARRIAAAMLAAVLLGALGVRPGWAAEPHPSVTEIVTSRKLNFLIYDPSNTELLGRGHYTVTMTQDSITIAGRNNYLNGSYDIEHEQLTPNGTKPRLVTYKHSFFNKRGAPQIIAGADPLTGEASCTTFHDARSDVRSTVLNFPSDTYAGASALMPISDQLKRNPSSSGLHFHVFDCAPSPRIFELSVNVQQALWRHLPHHGGLLKADARPVFGWFDIFLKSFVPETQFWFDPQTTFGFMGGTMSRYYGGPEIMLVRMPPRLAVPPLAATASAPPPLPVAPSAKSLASVLPTRPSAARPLPSLPAIPSVAEAKSRTRTVDLLAGDPAHPADAVAPPDTAPAR